jgi:hypothetical protein
MDIPAALPRQHEAMARQCLAETESTAGLHACAGPEHREVALNDLVERALDAYEGFRRLERATRLAWADGDHSYDAAVHETLARTARLHFRVGHVLVAQLDAAARARLTVRNVLPLRQAYAGMVALEDLDHGILAPPLQQLALVAQGQFDHGDAQQIDAEEQLNGVHSFRTWDFVKRTTGLPQDVQQLAERSYRRFFALDDRHPALAGRPVFGGRRPDGAPPMHFWSVEIGFTHRALAILFDETEARPRTYVWFWFGDAVHARLLQG